MPKSILALTLAMFLVAGSLLLPSSATLADEEYCWYRADSIGPVTVCVDPGNTCMSYCKDDDDDEVKEG